MIENALRVVRDGLAPLNALNAPPHALAALAEPERQRVLGYLNDEFPAQHVTTAAEQKIIDAFEQPEEAAAGAAAHMRAVAEGEEDEELLEIHHVGGGGGSSSSSLAEDEQDRKK